jgi:RNA polymerase sigma-70 factor, ECF subfamily
MAMATRTRATASGVAPPAVSDFTGADGFERLLDRHGPEVYRFLVHLTRNPADADDLYQEAALKAYRAFPRLDGNANHRAWLYRIASNTFLSDRRKHGRVGALADAQAAAIPAPATDDAARIDAGSALARVGPMIDALPTKQRLALIARKHHDLSYAEIAALLGCSEAAARANVHEAVRKLRDGLGDLLV